LGAELAGCLQTSYAPFNFSNTGTTISVDLKGVVYGHILNVILAGMGDNRADEYLDDE